MNTLRRVRNRMLIVVSLIFLLFSHFSYLSNHWQSMSLNGMSRVRLNFVSELLDC